MPDNGILRLVISNQGEPNGEDRMIAAADGEKNKEKAADNSEMDGMGD